MGGYGMGHRLRPSCALAGPYRASREVSRPTVDTRGLPKSCMDYGGMLVVVLMVARL